MNKVQFLGYTFSQLKEGYAKDLLSFILNENCKQQDADTLFRTLVLDEFFEVDKAREVYNAASSLITEVCVDVY